MVKKTEWVVSTNTNSFFISQMIMRRSVRAIVYTMDVK